MGITEVKLHIQLKPGVQLIDIYGYKTEWLSDYHCVISLGSICSDVRKQAVIAFHMDGRTSGIHPMIITHWSYRDDGRVQVMTPASEQSIQFSNHTSVMQCHLNNKVDKYLRLLQNPVLLEKALQYFEQGEIMLGEDLLLRRADEMLLCALRWNDADMLQDAELLYALARRWVDTYAYVSQIG
ncbi:hypothetical protein [Paenibacillus lemnae]|uniref:Uncharacterized protein n=1 Tax=Paenibacillus lemnae TaxID=1330551 RepID=A0A848M5Y2_PAELE|nr:hypothetical protein [Paenibacillus lemnae]NMO95223.1 hypothetical protein [Paenibacillus lemnae]